MFRTIRKKRLFKDIYLPGTNITVSSNGWISLEQVADPYTYQNGRLPAASASKSKSSMRLPRTTMRGSCRCT